MNSQWTTPVKGRICVRNTGQGVVAVGVLHLPEGVRLEEATPYPLVVMGDSLTLIPAAAGKPMHPDERAGGVGSWARMNEAWRGGREPGGGTLFDARFLDAFRRSNGWAFVAVARQDPFQDAVPHEHRQTHYWLDIEDGQIVPIAAPMEKSLIGEALPAILSGYCVWPDGQGQLHTLPTLCRADAEASQITNVLTALKAQGLISAEVVSALQHHCPSLERWRSYSTDERYEAFLGEMLKQGRLQVAGAMSAQQFEERHAASEALVKAIVVEERQRELKDLAGALGIASSSSSAPAP